MITGLSDEDILEIGFMLEHGGYSENQIDTYLAHHGVKGMKWGKRKQASAIARADERSKSQDRFGNRNNNSAQRNIDRHKRVAKGKASFTDTLRVVGQMSLAELGAEGFSVQGASQARLDRAKVNQRKIKAGQKRMSDRLNRLGGIDVRELRY